MPSAPCWPRESPDGTLAEDGSTPTRGVLLPRLSLGRTECSLDDSGRDDSAAIPWEGGGKKDTFEGPMGQTADAEFSQGFQHLPEQSRVFWMWIPPTWMCDEN